MLPVEWTDEARYDLLQIVRYVSQRNPSAAVKLGRTIEESTLPLAEHPYLFRTGRMPGTREIVPHPNYIVVYRVITSHVEILRVIHARRNFPAID